MNAAASLTLTIITATALSLLGGFVTDHTIGYNLPGWVFDTLGFDLGNLVVELVNYVLPWFLLALVVTIPLVVFTSEFVFWGSLVIVAFLITIDALTTRSLSLQSDSYWHIAPTILAWASVIPAASINNWWISKVR
ncbi:hypothetical protein [Echinimonas agarilytica]|uniref:Uncharacterized protein n=1 Tax=Echinimonas agarilytica TaxID=1215918 RepID=A0AA41W666_9GAMM|nr:hypothetical protein [Echinimonas agarilytica]MCM2679442.1 hypothetical protein [Echinimonas agarilytica]